MTTVLLSPLGELVDDAWHDDRFRATARTAGSLSPYLQLLAMEDLCRQVIELLDEPPPVPPKPGADDALAIVLAALPQLVVGMALNQQRQAAAQ